MVHGAARTYVIVLACAGVLVVGGLLARHVSRKGRILLWLNFLIQCAVAISIQVSNDQSTGHFSIYGSAIGIRNARWVVQWEMAHGLWVEPAWQDFFVQTRHLHFLTLSWGPVSEFLTNFYVFGHAAAAMFVAVWVWVYRRRYFPLVRNTFFITNGIAWFFYVHFPVAPPRLTPGLIYHGRVYVFRDPLYGVINGENIAAQYRFNEFSAVPSIHVAWATIFALTFIFLSRRWWAAALAALYPATILLVIVVTGNHYIFDGLAGSIVALAAGACAFALEPARLTLVRIVRNCVIEPVHRKYLGRSGSARRAHVPQESSA